jgi:phage shock protein A
MFSRIARLFQAFFNKFLTAAEDPVLILENNIREMKNQIPKLNEAVARAAGTVILLERQLETLKSEEKALRAKLKAAALSSEDQIGQEIALQLQRVLSQIEKLTVDLDSAQKGFKSMEEVRDAQIMRIKNQTAKIKSAIEDSKVSKLKGELASLFESYQVNDVASTNEEMLEKLEQETAMNEGKFQTASNTPDAKMLKIEKDAERIQAAELYKQFQAEMGLDVASSSDKPSSKDKATVKTVG